jgi:hypothetical protein
MATPRYISDLAGTLLSGFRIGLNKLVSAAGVVTFRNKEDTANVAVAASEARLLGATYQTTLAPASSGQTGNLTFRMPAADGSTDQAVCTDGAGNFIFRTIATGANAVKCEDQVIAFGSASPVTVVALPAGATIQRVTCEVETAFNGTPSLSVGLVGTISKYMGTTDMDLAVAATYEVAPMIEEAGAVSPIITYSAGGATIGSARISLQWVIPG